MQFNTKHWRWEVQRTIRTWRHPVNSIETRTEGGDSRKRRWNNSKAPRKSIPLPWWLHEAGIVVSLPMARLRGRRRMTRMSGKGRPGAWANLWGVSWDITLMALISHKKEIFWVVVLVHYQSDSFFDATFPVIPDAKGRVPADHDFFRPCAYDLM